MTGHSAKTAPLATEFKARLTGICQMVIAIMSATMSPASAAIHAGRRRSPKKNKHRNDRQHRH